MVKASSSGHKEHVMKATGKMITWMAKEPDTMLVVVFILATGKMTKGMVKVL